MVELNKAVPEFLFEATTQTNSSLMELKGKKIVFYFYPKDSTPGCTTESQDFRDHYPQFKTLNTEIFGISRDKLTSHEKFKEKQSLPFELISDVDESICELFDVMKQKSMFGKKYRGIERSTFVIDEKGILILEQRKIKIKNHVTELLDFLSSH